MCNVWYIVYAMLCTLFNWWIIDLVESITPEKLRNLRVILNSTAMDILYYTSPLYRGEVSRLAELVANTLYKFKWFKWVQFYIYSRFEWVQFYMYSRFEWVQFYIYTVGLNECSFYIYSKFKWVQFYIYSKFEWVQSLYRQ